MNVRGVVAGGIVALVLGLPALGWAEKSKRELLKDRFQQKNILLNAPASSQTYNAYFSDAYSSAAYSSPQDNRKESRRGKRDHVESLSEVSRQSLPEARQAEESPSEEILRGKLGKIKSSEFGIERMWLPVVTYAIYQTDYQVEIEEDIAFVRQHVQFEVFKTGATAKIPLVNADVGLKEVSLNQKPSIISREGQKYFLLVSKPGRYDLAMEYFVKVSREREHGPGQFSFEVLPSPISLLDVELHEPQMDVFVEPSLKLEKETTGNKTLATVVLPYTERVTVRWNKAIGKIEIAPVALEPKVYVDVASRLAVGEGLIHGVSDLRYSILQSEVSSLSVLLPEEVTVLDVQAGDLRDWKLVTRDGHPLLEIYLVRGIKGPYRVRVAYEKTIGEGSVTAPLPELTVLGVEREQGVVGIEAKANVEVAFKQLTNATQIDVKELPGELWQQAAQPILLAYKYLKHPVEATIDVIKHEELPVLVAAIDAAHYVSLLTREGKMLTKATLNTRNNVKQFMRLELPAEAELLTCFVSGKPVKPARDQAGRVLIPLEKSETLGETVAQFPVEVMYLTHVPAPRLLGDLRLQLPGLDIPTSRLYWSVYLPEDWNYGWFRGDVERMTQPVSFGLFARAAQRFDEVERDGALKKRAELNYFQSQKAMEQQVQQEFKGAYTRGILPIRIEMPTAGKVFRFSKLLVTEERPWLHGVYVRNLRQANGLLGWLVAFLIAWAAATLGGGRAMVSAGAAGAAALAIVWLAQVAWWVVGAALIIGGIVRLVARRLKR